MSVYKRPLRSDELMHWGNHKYIAKIGNRYFYTAEELKAFKQGAKGVGQRVSDNFDKLRQHAYDAAGGAAKRKAQASAKKANESKNDLANANKKRNDDIDRFNDYRTKAITAKEEEKKATNDAHIYDKRFERSYRKRNEARGKASGDESSMFLSIKERNYPELYENDPAYKRYSRETANNAHNFHQAELRAKKANKDKTNNEIATKYVSKEIHKDTQKLWNARDNAKYDQEEANRDKAAYDKTLLGRAESAKRSINHVKNTAAHKLESGKKKVDDYITKRQHDRIKIKAHEAEINPSGSTKEKNPFQEAYDRDQREKKRKKSTLRVAHHITVK